MSATPPPENQKPNPESENAETNPQEPAQQQADAVGPAQDQPAAYQGEPQAAAQDQPGAFQGNPQDFAPGQPAAYQGQPGAYPPGAPQLGPDGQPLQPGGYPQGAPQLGPDGQPLQPGYQGAPQFGPDGQPLPPGGYPPAAGGFMPVPPEQAKKNSVGKRILFGIIAAVVAIGVSIAIRSFIFDSPKMKAGDCVQREGEDSVKVVTCGTPEAQYSVLGVVEKQSRYSGQAGACNAYPDTTTVYWEGRNNSTGTVYCLKKL